MGSVFTPEFQKSFQKFVRALAKDTLLASTLLYLILGSLEIWREGMVKSVFPMNAALGVLIGTGILETLFRLQGKERKPQLLSSRETAWIFLIAVSFGFFIWQNVVKTAGAFAAATATTITITIVFLFLIAVLGTPKFEKTRI